MADKAPDNDRLRRGARSEEELLEARRPETPQSAGKEKNG